MRTVENNEFEKVSRSISTENQISDWILGDLLDDNGMTYGMEDVLSNNGVAER